MDRGRRTVGAAVGAGLFGTLLVSVLPGVRFAYRNEEAHIAIETAAFLVPALAALLFAGRALRAQSRTDLLVAGSLALIAATNLCFSLVPGIAEDQPGQFSTWAPVTGRILGAVAFAAAALLPDRRLIHARRAVVRMLLGVFVVLGLVALTLALLGGYLPNGTQPGLTPEASDSPRGGGHPLVFAVQVAGFLLYAAATAGFLRRAENERDALTLWLALAAALSGVARVDYLLFPSIYTEWVYVGDILRLGSFVALLVGISRELLAYQRRAAEAAALDERRRVARELHDGLAQELAFIRMEGERMRKGTQDAAGLARISAAAERAFGEARAAIAALTRPLDEPLASTLREAAEGVAMRLGARIEMQCTETAAVRPGVQHALERIVREATVNAVHHGQAKLVRIEVGGQSPLRVAIADDGRGFDPEAPAPPDSFGLVSMRERATGIGGRLSIRSEPGDGTTVEVIVP